VEGLHLERSVWLVRRRAVQSPAAKAFMQCAVQFGEALRSPTPAVLPTVLAPPRALAKPERVLLVKRRG
jgi:hypothetical protein